MSMLTGSGSLIGYFGKLPAFPDFVRQNAGGPLARALDTWIHEGVAHMNVQGGETWKSRFDAAAPKNFLFHVDDPSKFLVGILVPSRDKSGRRYPFSVFANVTPGKNGQQVHLMAEAHAVFLKAARRVFGDVNSAAEELRSGKVSALATALPQNLFECDRQYARFLELKKMSEFWAETLGDHAGQTRYLVMRNLLSALVPLRDKDLRKFELCLTVPIAPHASTQGFHIAVWLVLVRQFLQHPPGSIVAFWDAERSGLQARLYLFFRPPGPRYLACLLDHDAAGSQIWDMATLKADQLDQAKGQLPSGLATLLDDPALSVGAFINALGREEKLR